MTLFFPRSQFVRTGRAAALFLAGMLAAGQLPAEPAAPSMAVSAEKGWVTVVPVEFPGAINNPLKGFRDYKEQGYGLLNRAYIKWSDIEVAAGDSVERIIAYTNLIARYQGQPLEDLNVKIIPRVYLDWNGSAGKQYWPADLHTFDYDSPAFQERLQQLVKKLGEAWDNDPRIFAVQMGLIGYWGEHHTPAPTAAQRRLLVAAFQAAFKHKPVLVRHTNGEFMAAGFGVYYDTFANLSREPPDGPKDQFPWQATHLYPEAWKRAPIEGEVEYNWQNQRPSALPEQTFGRSPDETMRAPAYRRFIIDKIRQYHTSYLGWISKYDETDREVLAGAAELQKAFGYRFVLESVSYPQQLRAGESFEVKLVARNTGSAPFYLDWPVAVALLDPKTKKPVWSAPLSGVDLRRWLPGEDWDSSSFDYRKPALSYHEKGSAILPAKIRSGRYIIALAILDRQGGMLPSARFAIQNYFKGGWHPFGFVGVGEDPREVALGYTKFDSPAFDRSLHYTVPSALRSVKMPPLPKVQAVTPWESDPRVELINPWRSWYLQTATLALGKDILTDPATKNRIIRVEGDFREDSRLIYNFPQKSDLGPGRYRLTFRARSSSGQRINFVLLDAGRVMLRQEPIGLTGQWQDYVVDFVVTSPFEAAPGIGFLFPRSAPGTFDLTEPKLKVCD